MSYADQKAAILAHVVAAGAALTPPIQNVAAAFPLAAAGEPSIRVYYGGEAATEKMGGRYTLNSEMVGRLTLISAFWPITTLDPEMAALIDADMDALTHEMRTRIDGDATLGGTCTEATLDYAEPSITVAGGNSRWGTITWSVTTDYVEYARVP